MPDITEQVARALCHVVDNPNWHCRVHGEETEVSGVQTCALGVEDAKKAIAAVRAADREAGMVLVHRGLVASAEVLVRGHAALCGSESCWTNTIDARLRAALEES